MAGWHDYSDDDELLLGPAAALLGVHYTTLRRWADAGRVPVSRTPTNQRRFRVGDLRTLIVPEQRSTPSEDARDDVDVDDVDAEGDRARPRVGAA